jgi:hypothetical protein
VLNRFLFLATLAAGLWVSAVGLLQAADNADPIVVDARQQLFLDDSH